MTNYRYWFNWKKNGQQRTTAVIARNKEEAKRFFRNRFKLKKLPTGTKIQRGKLVLIK